MPVLGFVCFMLVWFIGRDETLVRTG